MLEQNIKKNNHIWVIIIFLSLMVFFSPLLYISPLHNPSALPRSAMLALISGLMLSGFSLFALRYKLQLILTRQLSYLILFVLWCSLSLVWSVHNASSYNQLMQLWPLLLVFVFASLLRGELKGRGLMIIVVVSVVAASMAAITGLWQNWGLDVFGLRYYDFMGSTFYLSNHAVLYFDLVFPVSLALITVVPDKKLKWLLALMSASILGYLLESHSRGSWLALTGILLISLLAIVLCKGIRLFIVEKCKGSWKMLLLVFVMGGAIFIAPGQVDKKWQEKTQVSAVVEGGATVRLVSYRNAINLLLDNPVTGVGYGAFWKGFREYTNTPLVNPYFDENKTLYRLHSDIYQIFIETGLVGGLLILGFLFYSLKSAIKLVLYHKNSDERILLTGVLLAILASLIHSLVDFPLLKPSSASQFFLWLGIIAAFSQGRAFSLPDSRVFRLGVLSISIIYFLIVGTFYTSYLVANHYFYKADMAFANNDCTQAKSYIDKSVNLFGLHLFSRLKRVDIYLQCESDKEILFNALNTELAWNDTEVTALLRRGDMYYSIGLYDKSQQDYAKVLSILPHRPLGAFKVAVTRIAQGNREQGVVELKSIAQKFPDFKPARDVLLQLEQR